MNGCFHSIDRRLTLGFLLLSMLVAFSPSAPAQAPDFRQPVALISGEGQGLNYRLTRNTQGQMAWGPGERLWLSYWDGQESGTTPDNPSRVWALDWSAAAGWSSPQRLDQSFLPGDVPIGGRQPALAATSTTLLAVWHDHRHTTQAGNYIDNIEIYGDTTGGDTFSNNDARLTVSNATTNAGDNGYLPQAATLPDGRVAVAWYDFHWAAEQAEIALRILDPAAIGAAPIMDDFRATVESDRAAGDAGRSFAFPSVAATPDGRVHVTWATDVTNTAPSLYYGQYDPATAQWIEKTRLFVGNDARFDPPRIVADAVSGDVWVVYCDRVTHGDDELVALRRAAGATGFDAPVRLTSESGDQKRPAVAVDADGALHVAYEDTADNRIEYLRYDPAGAVLSAPVDVTPIPGGWARPALLIDPEGWLHVAWEEQIGISEGAVWYTTDRPSVNAVRTWSVYR